MATYTFVMEYRGGTYVSQVVSASINLAVLAWAESLDVTAIQYLGPSLKQKIINALKSDPYGLYTPIALTGLKNVWCISTPLIKHASINAVKTATSKSR